MAKPLNEPSLIFRPFWGLTFASVVSLAILIALGMWQLKRLEWKQSLIQTIETRLTEPAVALDELLARNLSDDELIYRRVTVTGRFDHANEFHFFATIEGGGGYRVNTPLLRDGARSVLVNRGLVSLTQKDPNTRLDGQVEGEVTITGLLRVPGEKQSFTPDNDRAGNIWFWADFQAIQNRVGGGQLFCQ